jgi:hypothetical protein
MDWARRNASVQRKKLTSKTPNREESKVLEFWTILEKAVYTTS